jgi:hypothetical protein
VSGVIARFLAPAPRYRTRELSLAVIGMSRLLVRYGAPLVLLVLALPLIRAHVFSTNDAFDEVNYHRPIIATMAADFPAVDLVNYNAAMAPGYHVAMASVLRFSGSWAAVRAANLTIGVLLVVLAGHVAWQLSRAPSAALTTLTVAASSYVVSGSAWLTTDNLGLLLAMTSLSVLILRRPAPAHSLASGIVGALSALVRQIHVWTAAPIAVSALWPPSPAEAGLPPSRNASADRRSLGAGGQPRRTATALLATAALPILAVGALVLLWGGLLPPRFVGHHEGWNPAALSFGLSLLGAFGLPWLLLMTADLRPALESRAGRLVIALALCASLVPTSYDVQSGRWGGWLWEAVRWAPVAFGRSLVLPILGIVGACAVLTLVFRAASAGRRREAIVLVVALGAWMAAQSANFQVWQRYFEPATLILLSWLIALAPPPLDNARWVLPLAMVGLMLATTVLLVHGDVYGLIRAR